MGEQEIKSTVDENDAHVDVSPLLFTIPEAARVLALGRTTIYQLIAVGELEAIHVGRSRRVPGDALASFVARRRCHSAAVASAQR